MPTRLPQRSHENSPGPYRSRAGRTERETGRYPEFECSFTHRLLREAILSRLTPTRKRTLYRSIAKAFESRCADSLHEHFERLAHYYAQAGELPKALDYAGRARAVP